jgi:hypothetical protein
MSWRQVQPDERLRRFLLLRRIVVGCTIALFEVLSFSTEFGFFATFAGFSAAGIAVAMQSMILSMVAYFFFVGRRGVRLSDRVTVSGVSLRGWRTASITLSRECVHALAEEQIMAAVESVYAGVRYPVVTGSAGATDDRITRELLGPATPYRRPTEDTDRSVRPRQPACERTSGRKKRHPCRRTLQRFCTPHCIRHTK